MESCSSFYDIKQGKIVPMTASLKQMIEDQIEAMADQALRTIGIAYKEIEGNEGKTPLSLIKFIPLKISLQKMTRTYSQSKKTISH